MRKFIFLFIAFLTLSAADVVEYPLYVQKDDTQAKIKAMYIYNFTKCFEWTNNKDGNFTITILGENIGLVSELTNMAKTKMVGSQKIEIKNNVGITDVEKSNILFITPDKSHLLADVLSKFKGKGVFVIT